MPSPKISIQLSLDKYEIKLLEDYLKVFNKSLESYNEASESEDTGEVFNHWIWYRKVADNFRDFTREEVVRTDWGDNMEHGFGIFMHFLQFYSMDNLFFRTATLKGDNPHLLSDLLKVKKEETTAIELEIGMPTSEKLYWRLVTELYMDNMWGVPDSDDIPFMDVINRMRRPITVGTESDTEGEDGNEDVGIDSFEPGTSQAEITELLIASENMDVDEHQDRDDLHGELLDELNLAGNDESVHQGESLIDHDLDNNDNLQGHQMSDIESDEDIAEKEYIPFAIWSLLRKASILQRREDNSIKVFEFLDENSFFEFYAPVSEGLFCRSPEKKVWLSGIQARITHLGIVGHLSNYGLDGFLVIEDPRQFLEYIPWEELNFTEPTNEKERALWCPANPTATFDYYLFTEEEVYRYCVTNNFVFSGLFQDGRLVFKATEMEATEFVVELQQYWEKWNDCAVTQNPETFEWFLLETTPGMKFREMWKAFDRTAALTYFRNLVDRHRYGEPERLKETLGLRYNPKYENLLELIPFNQFEIDQEHPPMRGSRGLVYKASWKRPQKIGLAPRADLKVVLKTVQVASEKEKEAIFKELDVNFSALQGHVVNVTEFYGVTQREQESGGGNEIFIVSEYALLGPAEHFLETSMTGDISDWEMILRSIWNIASGLNVLHDHGVLHRDLHWGNVLVTTNKSRTDLLESVKSLDGDLWNLLISDLGEGKVIGGSSTIGRKYGPPEYRAPEIEHSNATYTAAADMYSLGQLAKDIVYMHWKAAEKNGVDSHLISKIVEDMISRLVESTDPKYRPTAKEVAEAMQNIWRKTMYEYDFHPEHLDLVPYIKADSEPEIPF